MGLHSDQGSSRRAGGFQGKAQTGIQGRIKDTLWAKGIVQRVVIVVRAHFRIITSS